MCDGLFPTEIKPPADRSRAQRKVIRTERGAARTPLVFLKCIFLKGLRRREDVVAPGWRVC